MTCIACDVFDESMPYTLFGSDIRREPMINAGFPCEDCYNATHVYSGQLRTTLRFPVTFLVKRRSRAMHASKRDSRLAKSPALDLPRLRAAFRKSWRHHLPSVAPKKFSPNQPVAWVPHVDPARTGNSSSRYSANLIPEESRISCTSDVGGLGSSRNASITTCSSYSSCRFADQKLSSREKEDASFSQILMHCSACTWTS
jgi:hypothetical protein